MRLRTTCTTMIILLTCCLAMEATAGTAADTFQKGQTLLAEGDFKGAIEAFEAAAKAQPANSDYFREAAVLRRVITIRQQLKTEQNAGNWERLSSALYNYYRQHEVYQEALALAGTYHERIDNAESAAMLADAHLCLEQNKEAAELLGALDKSKCSPHTHALHGVALARLEQLDSAKAAAARVEIPKDCTARLCFDVARLYALTGDSARALDLLKCCFENTPDARLAVIKSEAKECDDLSRLSDDKTFAKVMLAKSKVKGGCGGCSGSCSKGKTGCSPKETGKSCTGHEKQGDKTPACDGHKK